MRDMRNIVLKVFGYIFFRYFVFFIVLYTTDKTIKAVQSSDLKNRDDWFMLLWLFGLPVLLECLIISVPMGYGLNKLSSSNRAYMYALFLVLFVIEFWFANWIYGTQSAFMKIGISILLFFVLFWKRLF